MKKVYILILFVAMMPLYSPAQSIELTTEQKNEMKERIMQKLETFLDYLAYVASKDKEVQDYAIKSTLALFVGKGYPYEMPDQYGIVTKYDGVKMQTASIRKNRKGGYYKVVKEPELMRDYLQRLKGLPYSRVEIEQVGAIRVDNIYKTGDGRYQATAHFCQDFAGYRDGKIVYHDQTTKSIKIYIYEVDIDDNTGHKTWQILLGDMKVESISK